MSPNHLINVMQTRMVPAVGRLFGVLCAVVFMSVCSASAQDNTRYWNLSWSWEDVDIQKLSGRLTSVGIDIPVNAKGKATVDVQVGIPLNGLRSPEKYRLKGTISSARLQVDQLVWNDFQAVVDVRDGTASLQELHAALGTPDTNAAGKIEGTAELQFAPMGDLKANLKLDAVKVQPLHQVYLSAVGDTTTAAFTGTVGGDIQFRGPYQAIRDVSKWALDADVRIDQLRTNAFPAINLATGPVKIREGELTASDLRVGIAGNRPSTLRLAAHAELNGKRRFDIGVTGNDVPLTQIADLLASSETPWVTGELDLNLSASGKLGNEQSQWSELAEMVWQVDGQIASPKLTAAGINLGLVEHQIRFDQRSLTIEPIGDEVRKDMVIQSLAANYTLGTESLRLDKLDAKIFGGQFNGNAVLSRKDNESHKFDLQWRDIDFRMNAGAVSPVAVEIATKTSGKIDWTIPVDGFTKIEQHRGEVNLRLQAIEIAGVDVGHLSIDASAKQDAITLESRGVLFDGELSIKTLTATTPGMTLGQLMGATTTGEVTLTGVRAERVLAMVPESIKPKLLRRRWTGQLSAKAILQANTDAAARVELQSVVENVSLDGHELARRLKLDARLVDDRFVIDQFSGQMADGRIDATGRVVLNLSRRRLTTGQITARISSMEGSQLLSIVSPAVAKQIDGRVSARLVLAGGDRDRLSIRGSVTASDATTFGLKIDSAHSGISGWVSNRFDRWRFDLPTIAGATGDGRLAGRLELKSANRPSAVDMRSQWTMRRVDFAKTLQAAEGSAGTFGDGRLSGKLTLNANHVKGPQDLFGSFDFELDGSSGRSIPGLTDAQNFLGPVGLAGISFDQGRAKGVIGGGRATLQEFWLRSPQLMVWADGAVILANQRLDLEAVISTGNFESNSSLIAAIGLLTINYATPIGIVLQINRMVSNRTIFVDVVGPASDPQLRLKPLDTIRKGAATFLLEQFLPVPCQLSQQTNPLR